MTDRAELPTLADLPIPDDVRAEPSWPAQLLEMAAHVGPLATLRIVERRGGEHVYVPASADASPFADVLTAEQAATIARVYAGNNLKIPVGRVVLARARRAGVIAAMRAKRLSIGDGAKILQTSRNHASHLVNATDEGKASRPLATLPRRHDPRQAELFPDPSE